MTKKEALEKVKKFLRKEKKKKKPKNQGDLEKAAYY